MVSLNLAYGNGIIGIMALVLLVFVVYDVAANQKKMSTPMKILWIILSVVIPIIIPVIYYFVTKK